MNQQIFNSAQDAYFRFLTKIIEGKSCKKCKTFSMSTCTICRKCGTPFDYQTI